MAISSSSEVFPALEDIGEVGFAGLRRALVVEREAIGLHVVEPDVVGAAAVGLGEEQDGGGDARIRSKHATRQRDHGIQLLLLDQDVTQLLMRFAGAKQNPVGHDDRSPSAGLQKPQEQCEEE